MTLLRSFPARVRKIFKAREALETYFASEDGSGRSFNKEVGQARPFAAI